MKKKFIVVVSIILIQLFLVGFTSGTVGLKPITGERLMKLDGLGSAQTISDSLEDNEADEPIPTATPIPKPTSQVKPKPTPVPEKQSEVVIEIKGTKIKHFTGTDSTMEEIEKYAKDGKVAVVNVHCEYGDYKVVQQVMEILGDKFNEVGNDDKEEE